MFITVDSSYSGKIMGEGLYTHRAHADLHNKQIFCLKIIVFTSFLSSYFLEIKIYLCIPIKDIQRNV